MPRIARIALLLLVPATTAHADQPPPVDPPPRPPVEWSTWYRLGYGAASTVSAMAERSTTEPPQRDVAGRWENGLGADATLAVASEGDLRLGAWVEWPITRWPAGGIELLVGATPSKLDMFWYTGEGIIVARAGGNHEEITGAVAYGYRAPWALWGPWKGTTRYMIGVRIVASAAWSLEDPDVWSMTLGLETEPIGALRYLLGIRSWC